ncbi:type III-B CRISPR module-associated Cmr3 family protein [Candidatus Symbiobacter mobilis]|uniref:Uncharacterized protein n=1 Tax=Candidatus Symbiobacter mobilis CR TaxID=946483 RepID=U5N602_9BURK|nr:type III-B CRISPR module-associated Cmr3 family protein [Candidatus Symbiobacter mobilis]AGX86921.1 hypothetical protein Cenrod_0815 [Candidatus Symbiobacter mobilis CR]
MNAIPVFIQPTDTLFLRGNSAFGGAGEHGVGSLLPQPSVLAGALRSALLAQHPTELARFGAKGCNEDPALQACLGTPQQPGAFSLCAVALAQYHGNAATPMAYLPLPADLVEVDGQLVPLHPQPCPEGICRSGPLPMQAMLRSASQAKPEGGVWLNWAGWLAYLQGQLPTIDQTVKTSHLAKPDPRLGIGMDSTTRTTQQGLIYTTEGFAFRPAELGLASGSGVGGSGKESNGETEPPPAGATGYLAAVEGIGSLLPAQGLLRLGGDGRSARWQRLDVAAWRVPTPPPAKRFRLVLHTPGWFSGGWLPEGVQRNAAGDYILQGKGFSARLVCAAAGRRECISGWDLYEWKPKSAHMVVGAGSVYWFDDFDGDWDKLAEWVEAGLWPQNLSTEQAQRRAEGYNRAWLAAWPQD